jgi:hypothetical protein
MRGQRRGRRRGRQVRSSRRAFACDDLRDHVDFLILQSKKDR